MPSLILESFAYNAGDEPANAVWIADVRNISAKVVEGIWQLTGKDKVVQDRVMATSEAQEWRQKFLDKLPEFKDGDLVAFGCSEGTHRSVALVEVLSDELEATGWDIETFHRNLADTSDSDDDRDMDDKLQNMKKPAARNWYEIKNAASDTAEVFIYDQIGEDYWTGEGVTAKGFIDELSKITAPKIDLHLNSPGGSVFDGQAIYNALVRHPAKVTTYIDGLAASIASVIALAGERIVMAKNALFMIHNPMSAVSGYASDMRKMADVLDKIRESIVTVYNQHTNQAHEDIIAAMDAETWYTADEAVKAGFVHELVGAAPITAKFDLSSFGFRHAPTNQLTVEPVPEAEETVTDEVTVEPQDPESVGATDSESSDGASDTPPQNEVYVNGVGFLTF